MTTAKRRSDAGDGRCLWARLAKRHRGEFWACRARQFRAAIGLVLLLIAPLIGHGQGNPLGLEETPVRLYQSFRVAKPNPLNIDASREGRHETGIDLSRWLPVPGFQGPLGSCVTWAVGYAVKSFQENVERGWGVTAPSHQFSPSFLYNQITRGRNVGTSFQDSFAIVIDQGIASLKTMKYEHDSNVQPSPAAFEEAQEYRAASYSRVNVTTTDIKTVLDQGKCVLVGIKVYSNFTRYRRGIYSYISGNFEGGHAMVVVGYDDDRRAFKLINSWSTQWGEGGYCWIAYDLFTKICREAYILYDKIEVTPEKLAVPLNPTASRGTRQDRIKVSWDAVSNAVVYGVFRKAADGDEFEPVAQTQGVVYNDTQVVPEAKYFYAVQAANENGVSEYSEVAVGWAARPKSVAPPAPQNLEVRGKEGELFLKWDAVETAGGYYVYRWHAEAESYQRIGRSRDVGYRDATADITPGSVVHYIVTAHNEGGESKASQAVSFTWPEPEKTDVPEKLVPPHPISVTLDPRTRDLVISWNVVPGAEWYIMLKRTSVAEGWQIFERRVTGTRATDPAGRRRDYYIVVSANKQGYSDLSVYAGYAQTEYRNSRSFDDVEQGYYRDPFEDTFFDTNLFSDDEIFKTGDIEDFRGEYFDQGFFDDDTVSRFYALFNEKREAFEEERSRRSDVFDSFRQEGRDRFKNLLGD